MDAKTEIVGASQVKVHAPLANMVLALMASAIAGQDIMAQTVPRWTAAREKIIC